MVAQLKPLAIPKVYDYYFLSDIDVKDLRDALVTHGKGTKVERDDAFLGACIDMVRERVRLYVMPATWEAWHTLGDGVRVRRVRNYNAKRVRKVW